MRSSPPHAWFRLAPVLSTSGQNRRHASPPPSQCAPVAPTRCAAGSFEPRGLLCSPPGHARAYSCWHGAALAPEEVARCGRMGRRSLLAGAAACGISLIVRPVADYSLTQFHNQWRTLLDEKSGQARLEPKPGLRERGRDCLVTYLWMRRRNRPGGISPRPYKTARRRGLHSQARASRGKRAYAPPCCALPQPCDRARAR
jgi:hypothetical protein